MLVHVQAVRTNVPLNGKAAWVDAPDDGQPNSPPPPPPPPLLPPQSAGQFTAPSVLLHQNLDLEKSPSRPKSEDQGTLVEPIQNSTGPTYPDGGKQAYCAALGGALVLFSTFGAVSNAWGVIQAELQRNQLRNYSSSEITWIGSTHLFFTFVMALPMGRLFDLGYYRLQLALGSALFVIGVFMLSLCQDGEYYQFFLSYSVCMGIGLGTVFSPTVACVGSFFLKKRGVMNGCIAAGAALGAIVTPIQINKLLPKIGYEHTIQSVGGLTCGLLIVANLLIRPRKLPPKKSVPVVALVGSFLRQPSTWLVSMGAAMIMLGMFIPLFYIQIFAEANGADKVVVTYILSIINASTAVSRVVIGLVADRFGIINTAIPIAFGTGVLIFAMLGATSTASAVIWGLLYGWFAGAWVTLMAPSLMSLADSVAEIGVRSGLGLLFVSLAVLVGNPIAGALLARAGGYYGPCVFGGTAVCIGAGLLLGVRMVQTKKKGTWKV